MVMALLFVGVEHVGRVVVDPIYDLFDVHVIC